MKRMLNVREQEALLSQPDPQFRTELRNLVFLHLSLNNGVPMEKLLQLAWDQIDVSDGKVLVTVPENELQERMVLHSETLVALLDEWKGKQLSERQNRSYGRNAPEEPPEQVFTDLDGRPVNREHMTKIIALYADCAGIRNSVLPGPLDEAADHLWFHKEGPRGK
jgi:site-specific recombinase XerD